MSESPESFQIPIVNNATTAITGWPCTLCGHDPSCGYATVPTPDRVDAPLCHTDDHSCYNRWTVYGERPKPQYSSPSPIEPPTS